MNSRNLFGSGRDPQKRSYQQSAHTYLELYLKASAGELQAQYDLGRWYLHRWQGDAQASREAQAALEWYQKAATSGHPCAQYRYGLFFEHGIVVAYHDQSAEYWVRQGLRQAQPSLLELLETEAKEGDADALNALGCAHFFGYGVQKDEERTFELWKRAAALGSARGYFHLSCAYHSGVGTPADTQLSIACCRTAAELGMGVAAHRMGLRYLHGNGVAIEHDTAYRFFRMGVLRGYSLSLTAVRFLLATGLQTGAIRPKPKTEE